MLLKYISFQCFVRIFRKTFILEIIYCIVPVLAFLLHGRNTTIFEFTFFCLLPKWIPDYQLVIFKITKMSFTGVCYKLNDLLQSAGPKWPFMIIPLHKKNLHANAWRIILCHGL